MDKKKLKIVILNTFFISTFFYPITRADAVSNEPIIPSQEQKDQKVPEIIQKPKNLAFVLAWDLTVPVLLTGVSLYCTNLDKINSESRNIYDTYDMYNVQNDCLSKIYVGLALFSPWTLMTDKYTDAPLAKKILTPVIKLGVSIAMLGYLLEPNFCGLGDEDIIDCERGYKNSVNGNKEMLLIVWAMYSLESLYHVYKVRKYNNLIEEKNKKQLMMVPIMLKDRYGMDLQLEF